MSMDIAESVKRVSGGRGPKQKGAVWEIAVCRLLALWVSEGKRDDLYWRSAMSGGRATKRFDVLGARQHVSGDICAVDPLGASLTDHYHIECKHLASLDLTALFLRDKGSLATAWTRCIKQAVDHGKQPMLIAKQNLYQPVIVVPIGHGLFTGPSLVHTGHRCAIYLLANVLSRRYIEPHGARPVQQRVERERMNRRRVEREVMNGRRG